MRSAPSKVHGSVRLISIASNMHRGAGHHLPYHKAVGRAAALIGWEHEAACPSDDAQAGLPPNWDPCLYKGVLYYPLGRTVWWLPVKAAMKVYGIARFWWALTRYLRRRSGVSGSTVLFVDDPGVPQLIALTACLPFVARKGLRIWVMYRTRVYDKQLRAETFLFLHRLMRAQLEENAVQLLTDSDVLANSLEENLREPLVVMPIPHLEHFEFRPTRGQDDNEIRCWWPGAPRTEKGLAKIRTLISCTGDSAQRLRIMLAESAVATQSENGPRLSRVADKLPREEYLRLMRETDVILLPYDPSEYGERTSGIFVESIAAGKVPVVTDGTWMARELRRHGLESLILDWNSPSIATLIIRVASDEEIQTRLTKMKNAYLSMHGERAFGAVMEQLL